MQVKIDHSYYTHSDGSFLLLESILAIICLFIPLILFLVHGELLESISAYVNMNRPHIYGILLSMASMMFLSNGALYFKIESDVRSPLEDVEATDVSKIIYNKKQKSKWYNLVLGIALLGIAIVPYDGLAWLHYFFAIVFFVGSAIIIYLIHDPRDRLLSRIMAIASLAGLVVSYFIDYKFALFWAETFALIVIGIHYILESRRIWMRRLN